LLIFVFFSQFFFLPCSPLCFSLLLRREMV
jgi:hypothetical protein